MQIALLYLLPFKFTFIRQLVVFKNEYTRILQTFSSVDRGNFDCFIARVGECELQSLQDAFESIQMPIKEFLLQESQCTLHIGYLFFDKHSTDNTISILVLANYSLLITFTSFFEEGINHILRKYLTKFLWREILFIVTNELLKFIWMDLHFEVSGNKT